MTDWARHAVLPRVGVELLSAHFEAHAYDRHSHPDYAVGVTESGVQAFRCRGADHASTAGTVLVFNPDEAHDGHAGAAGGFTYRMFYLPPALMAEIRREATGRALGLPLFRDPLIADRRVARRLSIVHRILCDGVPALEQETLLLGLVRLLDGGHVEATPASGPPGPAEARVRDCLHARFAEDLDLGQLAEVAGMDRFRLNRAFRARFGLPPHAYLTGVRLAEAKRLLVRGEPAAEVAAAVGFVDQSHLTRRFKGAFGITPGQFAQTYKRAAGAGR